MRKEGIHSRFVEVKRVVIVIMLSRPEVGCIHAFHGWRISRDIIHLRFLDWFVALCEVISLQQNSVSDEGKNVIGFNLTRNADGVEVKRSSGPPRWQIWDEISNHQGAGRLKISKANRR